MTCLQLYTKMERVGLLIAVLGNITALLHNIISKMCRPYRTCHTRAGNLVLTTGLKTFISHRKG